MRVLSPRRCPMRVIITELRGLGVRWLPRWRCFGVVVGGFDLRLRSLFGWGCADWRLRVLVGAGHGLGLLSSSCL